MEKDSQKIEFANTLRGAAALSVMLAHYCIVFWEYRDIAGGLTNSTVLSSTIATPPYLLALNVLDPFSFGIFGVALFFLISGFVIPFSFQRTDWRGFLVGRTLRIYPTYWVGLTTSILVILISGSHYGKAFPYAPSVVMTNYFPGLRDVVWVAGIDGIIWTLDIEVKFYLVCALASVLLSAGRPLLFAMPLALSLLAVLAAPSVTWLLKAGNPSYGYVYTLCASIQYLDFMFIGVAFNFLYRRHLSPKLFLAIVAALFIAMAAICWRASTVPFNLMLTYGIALLVFAAAFVFPSVCKSRPLTDFLASISYPLYVVHGVLGYAVLRLTAGAGCPAWLAIFAAVVSAIAVATTIHYAVESPAHSAGRALAARFRSGNRLASGRSVP